MSRSCALETLANPRRIEMLVFVEHGEQRVEQPAKNTATPIEN